MKKFCSSCGSQLELSKRACGECGAANPFFIANFTFLEDQSNDLEKLRLEKEKIEKELAEKEAAQAEFQRQEQLKKELEELERQKRETLEKEMQIREALEQTPEALLKKKLDQVKQETDSYKKETLDLLQEIREELKQKTEELNRKSKTIVPERSVYAPPPPERTEPDKPSFIYEAPEKKSTLGLVAGLAAVLLIGFFGYLYLNQDRIKQEESAKTNIEQEQSETPSTTPTAEPKTENSFSSTTADTVGMGQSAVENKNPIAEAGVITKPASSPAEAVSPKFELSVSRAMNDLIGRKLSGCAIVIHSVSEISNISHPVLIEKMQSGYLKYKLNLKVTQSSETYTSSPYLYYTSDGRFLKIDGTNCE